MQTIQEAIKAEVKVGNEGVPYPADISIGFPHCRIVLTRNDGGGEKGIPVSVVLEEQDALRLVAKICEWMAFIASRRRG